MYVYETLCSVCVYMSVDAFVYIGYVRLYNCVCICLYMYEYMCVIVFLCLFVFMCIHEVLYVLGYVSMCDFFVIVNV